jgi:hypothetical protein
MVKLTGTSSYVFTQSLLYDTYVSIFVCITHHVVGKYQREVKIYCYSSQGEGKRRPDPQ